MTQLGYVVAVCSSPKKGMRKKNIGQGLLVEGHGLKDDAHAGPWHRQVSLLALESVQKMRDAGLNVHPGDFAENISTVGIDLVSLPLGTKVAIGERAVGEVTQIGKECHSHCAIYHQAGDCVMPREGIFIQIIQGGLIKVGDAVRINPPEKLAPPILSVVGWSGVGKTTFLEKLVAVFKQQNIRVGIIKHHQGELELDVPGTDTWRLKQAGAVCTAISSSQKLGLALDLDAELDPQVIADMFPRLDLILTEGYKGGHWPQVEVRRAGVGETKPAAKSGQLVAVVGESDLNLKDIPCFDTNDVQGVADFISQRFLQEPKQGLQ